MKLRGIDFGNILGASGVQGFFGEGYWFHGLSQPLGLSFRGMTFVSKTATLLERIGNMPLASDYRPERLFPDCVRGQLRSGHVLNAVGLSNPGLEALLATGRWQKRKEPFMISLMCVTESPDLRKEEMELMIDLLERAKEGFVAPFGLQINLSCPNTGHDPAEAITESADLLAIASRLQVPLMPKFSIASASVEAVCQLQDDRNCDAICVSNTIPFGWSGLNWLDTWGSTESPLAKYGGGGLSGPALRPLVCAWIKELRAAGFRKPINGGGGIMSADDVREYRTAGASSAFLGTAAIVRPWRVSSIIRQANRLDWR